jgi:uncharacterized protein
MSMKRSLLTDMLKWKYDTTRKPMILRGARQVGKTSLVNEFSKNYKQYIYLNLELDKEIKEVVDDVHKFIDVAFFLKKKKKQLIGETLLFMDEIQEMPEAINLLRYLYELYPALHVIAAGSLLENVLNEQTKYPVGRVHFKLLHPLSFTEFLGAIGEEHIIEQLTQLDGKDYMVEKIFELYHTYAMIGGMPEVVDAYIKNGNDLTLASQKHSDMLEAYMNDVPKYAKTTLMTQVIRHCIQHVFNYGGARVSFANFGNSSYKSREVGDALKSLQQAFLIDMVYPFTNTDLPMMHSYRKQPKLFVLDTGMMNHLCGLQDELIFVKDLNEVYTGRVVEQMVAQEMKSTFTSPLEQHSFWINDTIGSDAEVDFGMRHGKHIIPIEVKSGKIGKLKSLLQFMDRCSHTTAVRLYRGPVLIHKAVTPNGKEFTLINLPYFLGAYIHHYVAKVL